MTSQRFELDEHCYITYRLTPWDGRAFDCPTSELLELRANSAANYAALLEHFDQWNSNNSISFSYTRIPGWNRASKEALQRRGFYCAETSLSLSHANLRNRGGARRNVSALALERVSDSSLIPAQQIAKDDFHFSRFHDDIRVPLHRARQRYLLWIGDLFQRQSDLFIAKHNNAIVGLHAESVDYSAGHADLILTGITASKSQLAIYLWESVFQSLCNREIFRCKTLVSAANTGVINLYRYFGFTFDECYHGYHKMYHNLPQ